MVTDKLKQLIFKHLYKELGNVEIIPYKDSVWFIDRENCYWYFQLSKDGCLFWRYSFFPSFFSIFSLEQSEFEPIISSWVEEVLNHKVSSTEFPIGRAHHEVEEVLNHKVSTTLAQPSPPTFKVEEVLNHKVSTTCDVEVRVPWKVEEVLNHKVTTTYSCTTVQKNAVDDVLNHKSFTKIDGVWRGDDLVEEILNENPTE